MGWCQKLNNKWVIFSLVVGFHLLSVLRRDQSTGIILKVWETGQSIAEQFFWAVFSGAKFCCFLCQAQFGGCYSSLTPHLCRQRRFEQKLGKVQGSWPSPTAFLCLLKASQICFQMGELQKLAANAQIYKQDFCSTVHDLHGMDRVF